jgi:hypothetical protein
MVKRTGCELEGTAGTIIGAAVAAACCYAMWPRYLLLIGRAAGRYGMDTGVCGFTPTSEFVSSSDGLAEMLVWMRSEFG